MTIILSFFWLSFHFWIQGAEKLFWKLGGVYSTHVGYAGGTVKNPTYELIKSGKGTRHAEVVRIVYDPLVISYHYLLMLFFENHDVTQGDRQGEDVGIQYRSVIFPKDDEQLRIANQIKDLFQGKKFSLVI